GNPNADLVFVGEAPGFYEDKQGKPFVGKAGQLLTDIIEKGMKLRRDDVYICNVLKCRPPGNKLLSDGSDIAACSAHLWTQLRLLPNLRVIVALGKVASITLLGATEDSIPKRSAMTMEWLRKHAAADPPGALPFKLEPYTHVRFWPTYHPAYLLRRRNDTALHAEAWADLKRAVEALR
ncbi:uracil-DNA glycosylase, partial [bacterium]|nr:uracil-DNA glycosylase [bacterium]